MRSPTTVSAYLELLKRSALLSESFYEQASSVQAHSPLALTGKLVNLRLLTRFQANQLLKGRHQGFYMGNYKLMELLGRGGMSNVYLAEQIRLQSLVAVKVFRVNGDKKTAKSTRARFIREAETVAALRHPNIIEAFDFDEADGIPYIVMEYLEGIDLERLVKKTGVVGHKQAAHFVAQAANGLEYAHQSGLVHRDVKPSNLFLLPDGSVKLLDMGLVSQFRGATNDSLTTDEERLGTADYMAPEQALDSHNVDIRSDIYSLGAVLYFLLSGRPLFPKGGYTQKLLLHQTQEPTPIQDLVPDLPREISSIVRKMITKSTQDRVQTPKEVVELLRPFSKPARLNSEDSTILSRKKKLEVYLGKSPDPTAVAELLAETSRFRLNHPSSTEEEDLRELILSGGVAEQQSTAAPSLPESEVPVSAENLEDFEDEEFDEEDEFTPSFWTSAPFLLSMAALLGTGLLLSVMLIPGFAPRLNAKQETKPNETEPKKSPTPRNQDFVTLKKSDLPLWLYRETGQQFPFDPQGYLGQERGVIQDFDCTVKPYQGETCLRCQYTNRGGWGGAVWLHPPNNWGQSAGGYDLRAATVLRFHARGATGSERVEFQLGMAEPGQRYPDTGSLSTGVLSLTTEWQQIEIPLSQIDASRMKAGFLWKVHSPGKSTTFFLDDIRFE